MEEGRMLTRDTRPVPRYAFGCIRGVPCTKKSLPHRPKSRGGTFTCARSRGQTSQHQPWRYAYTTRSDGDKQSDGKSCPLFVFFFFFGNNFESYKFFFFFGSFSRFGLHHARIILRKNITVIHPNVTLSRRSYGKRVISFQVDNIIATVLSVYWLNGGRRERERLTNSW